MWRHLSLVYFSLACVFVFGFLCLFLLSICICAYALHGVCCLCIYNHLIPKWGGMTVISGGMCLCSFPPLSSQINSVILIQW